MGSAPGIGYLVEHPQHTVNITGFRISECEVTQARYAAIMGDNPSQFDSETDSPERPVEQMTWYDAVEFCNKLSLNDGYQQVYAISGRDPETGYPIMSATVTYDMTKNGYRLPTEAEWEYAAKGGNLSPGGFEYSGSNDIDTVAWYIANSGNTTHPVGKKLVNGLGLYDMCGNVYEYCQDWMGSYGTATQNDPEGPLVGSHRVCRGGSWYSSPYGSRSPDREQNHPEERNEIIGLRVARRP